MRPNQGTGCIRRQQQTVIAYCRVDHTHKTNKQVNSYLTVPHNSYFSCDTEMYLWHGNSIQTRLNCNPCSGSLVFFLTSEQQNVDTTNAKWMRVRNICDTWVLILGLINLNLIYIKQYLALCSTRMNLPKFWSILWFALWFPFTWNKWWQDFSVCAAKEPQSIHYRSLLVLTQLSDQRQTPPPPFSPPDSLTTQWFLTQP